MIFAMSPSVRCEIFEVGAFSLDNIDGANWGPKICVAFNSDTNVISGIFMPAFS